MSRNSCRTTARTTGRHQQPLHQLSRNHQARPRSQLETRLRSIQQRRQMLLPAIPRHQPGDSPHNPTLPNRHHRSRYRVRSSRTPSARTGTGSPSPRPRSRSTPRRPRGRYWSRPVWLHRGTGRAMHQLPRLSRTRTRTDRTRSASVSGRPAPRWSQALAQQSSPALR
jgi:hypothetical protein